MPDSYQANHRLTALGVELGKTIILTLGLLLLIVAVGSGAQVLGAGLTSLSTPAYVLLGTGVASVWLTAVSTLLVLIYAYGERQKRYST
jgi:cytochrome c oxidase assembly factor CtaG